MPANPSPAIANPYEQEVRDVVPTAVSVGIRTIEFSERVTKIEFEARLADGSWLTGTLEPRG